MASIYMNQDQVQAMISYNKKEITALTAKQNELKGSVRILWEASDPMNTNVDSITAFTCLNIAKDQLRKVKKDIKVLSQVQSALKCSIR